MTDARETRSHDDHRGRDADENVARLLRAAGRRPPIPADDEAILRSAAEAEWQRQVRARSRRVLSVRAGGLLAAAAVLFIFFGVPLLERPPEPGEPVATLAARSGSLRLETADSEAPTPNLGDLLRAGDVLETNRATRAALELRGGASLRLDVETRLRLASANEIELQRGAVYYDSRPEDAGGGIEIETPFGTVRDIGTQFDVRALGEDTAPLRVRVREGEIIFRRDGTTHAAAAGEMLEVSVSGDVTRHAVASHGDAWSWVLEASPTFAIEGRTVRELLEWTARELGLELRFADAAAESLAAKVPLSGSAVRPETAPAVLPASGLTHEIEDGVLRVDVLEGGSESP